MAPNPFTEIYEKLDALTLLVVELNRKVHGSSKTAATGLPMNVQQAADYLDMAKATVYVLTHKREIPHFKRGKRVFFYEEDLEKWLKEKRQKTVKEIQDEA